MKKRPLYIFGAAGFAAETALIALETGLYEIAAFVEADRAWMPDHTAMELKEGLWIPIVQETQLRDKLLATPKEEREPLCGAIAIANAKIARGIVSSFDGLMDWPSIVHPDAHTEAAAEMGRGNICYRGVIISWNARVGDFTSFRPM